MLLYKIIKCDENKHYKFSNFALCAYFSLYNYNIGKIM